MACITHIGTSVAAKRHWILGVGDEEMSRIARSRRQRRRCRFAATLRADGGCRRSLRCEPSSMKEHRLPPRASTSPARPIGAGPDMSDTGHWCARLEIRDMRFRSVVQCRLSGWSTMGIPARLATLPIVTSAIYRPGRCVAGIPFTEHPAVFFTPIDGSKSKETT